ncbi:MAG: GDSL-type esterase/lipase family protein [Endomicrobiales bacterium]
MAGTKSRAAAVAAGIVMTALILELGLRIVGYLQTSRAGTDDLPQDKGKQVILCLGDSFVFGMGAPAGKSFPRQLEELFNRNTSAGGKKYRVINGGVPGQNTSQLLERLPHSLRSAQPDLVLLLSGGANNWNTSGYAEYLRGRGFYSLLWKNIDGLRVYRLVKLLAKNCAEKSGLPLFGYGAPSRQATVPRPSPDHCIHGEPGADRRAANAPDQVPRNPRCFRCLAEACRAQGKIEEAKAYIEKAMEKGPRCADDCFCLGEYCRDRKDLVRAASWYMEGITLDPGKTDNSNYRGIKLLMHDCRNNDPVIAEVASFLKKLRKETLTPKHVISDLLETAEQGKDVLFRKTLAWVEHDIDSIIALCRKERTRIVLIGYPMEDRMNRVLEKSAVRNGVLFVENNAPLRELLGNAQRSEYFTADSHCTAKGYGVMARNVYGKIRALTE